jgi:hypothetical protein
MLLTTKLVVILLGGGAVIGAVGTRVTSDLIAANVGTAIPTQPCTVIYVPPQPPVKRERPVGVPEVFGKFSDLFKLQQQGQHK